MRTLFKDILYSSIIPTIIFAIILFSIQAYSKEIEQQQTILNKYFHEYGRAYSDGIWLLLKETTPRTVNFGMGCYSATLTIHPTKCPAERKRIEEEK